MKTAERVPPRRGDSH